MIELIDLTKCYGATTAVDGLSVSIQSGMVTGFLGPNGAGKSTTMRMIVGLDKPTAGRVLIDGKALIDDPAPMTTIGALLDAGTVPKACSGRNYLLGLAATHGFGATRVDQLLELTGLTAVAHRPFKTYSLGMGQRLGIAAALIGDPEIVLLDEPVNGLDPEGVLWVRSLVKQLAAEGRTVFLSSHLMSEMAQTADHLIILGRGHLLADTPMDEFLRASSEVASRVRSPQAALLAQALAAPTVRVSFEGPDEIIVHGVQPGAVGQVAAQYGWVIDGLAPVISSLEDAYMQLTDSSVEYRSGATAPQPLYARPSTSNTTSDKETH
ncbi:MAG: ATP-binding cassette domain-containing protein [Propionibacteriaceae bacterium]|nr:ATP-binding cassette domain-containing protein [Propionibacteriaceae bacterium]